MTVITVKELQALGAADNGQRVSMGNSLYGTVRAGSDGVVSVYVVWRYKVSGKVRQIPVGTWKDKHEDGMSLLALRKKRDAFAAELKKGSDPIERKAADKLKIEIDKVEAHHHQLDRLEEIAEKQARLTVRSLFDLWRGLCLKKRIDGGTEAQRSFERDVFPLIGNMAVADVKKAHVQHIVDTMMARDIVRSN